MRLTRTCILLVIGLAPLVQAQDERAKAEAQFKADLDAFYTPEHYRDVAQGLQTIRDYALKHPLGLEIKGAIPDESKHRSLAGIDMVYTNQVFQEAGTRVHQHMLSMSMRGRFMPTAQARALGAYAKRLLPIGTNSVAIFRSERGTLFVVLRLSDEADRAFVAQPVQMPEEPLQRVIVDSILVGKTLGIPAMIEEPK